MKGVTTMPVIKRDIDNNEFIEFKTIITLSSGVIGKNIIIDNIETNYIITEDSSIYNIITEKELKQFVPAMCPYKSINIQLGKKGLYKTQLIHRLMGKAFIPNKENKSIINHKDGDKFNNSIDNLEWVTYAENNKHAFEHGLKTPTKGSSYCTFTIYTEEDVIKVCESLEKGESPKSISEKYNYGYNFILHIRRGDTWTHISKNYKFPNIKRYSKIFTLEEMERMNSLFELGKSVREVIDIMNWEYDEKIRSNVKHQKQRWESDKIYEAQVKPL